MKKKFNFHSMKIKLSTYLKAGEIYDLLNDPDNEEYIAAARKYTDKFSADVDNLEGIYASSWDTQVRTHTNANVVGEEPFVLDIIDKAASGGEVAYGAVDYTDENGVDSIAAYNSMRGCNMVFIFAYSAEEALMSINDLRVELILLTLIFSVLLLAIVYIFVGRLISPLKKVERAVVDVGNIISRTSEKISSIIKTIDDIAESGAKRADMVVRVGGELDRISTVARANSETAGESAAASHQLSGQAGALRELIGRFSI